MVDAAIRSFHLIWYCEFKATIPTVSVFNESLDTSTDEYIYSFQPLKSTNIATAAIPGRINGTMIFQNIQKLEAPSTLAASSSSIGIVLKYDTSIQVLNATSIRPNNVLVK